ncbi:hypothetical protein CISG_10015 [Coccidioides immitis RMSCC 3703]|uniref:Uncharacterized protein n=2 Tax=Coccidioides TaxID=5500 RepID=A0A0J8QMG0_COCIT|nr:hypothetical protein CPAG_00132 [Coccidioides posadasii RMSCC 3488]KMU73569.1 hypothetical protein CISG_10015 [Coccidioides immitis RMSCC 3703]
MDLDEIVLYRPDEPKEITIHQELAAVITQAFSYMIKSGVGYRYVSTREAFIFLHMGEDLSTMFYYLAVPGDDVGESTEYAGQANHLNRLHLTAVGQVLALTGNAVSPKLTKES